MRSSCLALSAIALLASACSKPSDGTAPKQNLDGITQDAGTMTLTETDNGMNLVLGVGERFNTKLESVPTAGYSWHVTHLPKGLRQTEPEAWEPTDPENQSQPGFTGGSHYILNSFEATEAGDYDLVMIEGRVWELFEEDNTLKPDWKDFVEGRFQIRVRVRD